LIAAALSTGESVIHGLASSEDISATCRCLDALGATFQRIPDGLKVCGMSAGPMSPLRRLAFPRLDCGESGSTLRFLIPVSLAVRGGGIFTGRGRLMERPQSVYFDLFREKGIFMEQKDGVLTVQGMLTPGEYRLPGNVSSQFVTGLLYALPLLAGDSRIVLTTDLESAGYVNLTRQVLAHFGVTSAWEAGSCGRCLRVPGGQTYRPASAVVELDWSQAAFWYAAAALGSEVTVQGMNSNSLQMDREIVSWIQMISGQSGEDGISTPAGQGEDTHVCSRFKENTVEHSERHTVSLDVSMNPDIVPPIAAVGALMDGTLYLKQAARLRLKESDRLTAIREELCKLGAHVVEKPDCLIIEGRETLHGAVVDAHNDHRIAMMLAIAATRADSPVSIMGAESVRKSYPHFWEDYASLGGRLEVTEP